MPTQYYVSQLIMFGVLNHLLKIQVLTHIIFLSGIFPFCRLRHSLPFVSWNQEGWKTGLCSIPPVGHSHSLLALANNTCVKPIFIELRERFTKLYRKKVLLKPFGVS